MLVDRAIRFHIRERSVFRISCPVHQVCNPSMVNQCSSPLFYHAFILIDTLYMRDLQHVLESGVSYAATRT